MPTPDHWPLVAGILAAALLAVALAAAIAVLRLRRREREARAVAEAASERMHRALDGISDGFLMLDPEWRLTYANRTAQLLLRRSREELVGREAREIFPPSIYLDFYRKYRQEARAQGSTRFEASTADDAWIEVHVASTPEGVAMYFRDVTERRRHEEKLRSMTLVDELTGLYNRRGFFALAEQQCKLAARKGRSLFVVFADMDDLKRVNDTFGHTAGDQALFETAAVLRHTFRETDVVARIGGDEFAALVLESDPDTAPVVLRRLEANLQRTNAEGTLPFEISLSVGVASFDSEDANSIDELLSLADHRMYEQKRARRGWIEGS
jgi:diguanylate cyclase (GGDEF)-like protein/PAS domain S-box-containing protein